MRLCVILSIFVLAMCSLSYGQITENCGSVSFGVTTTAPETMTTHCGNPTSNTYTSVSFQNAGPFSFSAPSTVGPYASIPVTITFNPTAAGSSYSGVGYVNYACCGLSGLKIQINVSGTYAYIGSVYPKYQVISVIYAPPGQASSVNYGTSTQMGTSTSWGSSTSKSTALSTSLKVGVLSPINTSQTWTQTADTSTTISVNKSSSLGISVPGPANSNVGIDHDFDIIEVWLNPKDDFTVTASNSAQWKYNFDPRDPANEMDVVPLYVHELKNPSTIPAGKKSLLARSWAGTGQGLTTADYNQILARDPFANGSTTIDTTRFHLQIGQTLAYDPPPCGGQPLTNTYTQTYQTSTTQDQSASDSYSVSYTKSAGANFTSWLSANFLSQTTLTWTNKWGHQSVSGSGNSATVSITGPSSCTYSGPEDVQVYEDNVYGTFLFTLF